MPPLAPFYLPQSESPILVMVTVSALYIWYVMSGVAAFEGVVLPEE